MPGPLRIAVVEPLPLGGLLHYATQLADGLAQTGSEVTLVVARDNELAGRSGPARRRAVLPPDPSPAPTDASRAQVLARRARTARRIVTTWARIIAEARREDYDVVLLNGSFDLALTAVGGLTLTRLASRPIAHVCHNVRPFNRWGGDQMYIDDGPTVALMRRLYPRFDLVFVHGERSRREFEGTWPPTRLAVIPHGDEGMFAERPAPAAREPRILFFGAWRKMKGLGVLMDAFDLLTARRPDVRLTIAGPPVPEEGEAERVRAWARDRSERVELVPEYVAVEDVPGLFARARVVVLPYLAGYQSGVVHLAMTLGRSVVASAVGDIPDAVADGETGILVAPGEPEQLARALERLLDDPGLAERMGQAGRRRVEDGASWSEVARQVETELSRLSVAA